MTDRKSFDILVLEGDGIGPEVAAEALKVLDAAGEGAGLEFHYHHALVGGAAIDEEGAPISQETMRKAEAADAIILGAVGGPKWDDLPTLERPEQGLLGLRMRLDLFANLRPATVFEPLADASTLKREVVSGIDLLVVRELVSDLYFGEPRGVKSSDEGRVAFNTMRYSDREISRVARVAFDAALRRRRKVTSVDKANVLEVSGLWREVVCEVAREYPDVELDHQYVDNCSMQLIRDPSQFDVILTGNMFGDILSDEAAMLTGSIGMLPSASLGADFALYEPVHGSAPDIAGQDRANPLATILSIAMLLEITCKDAESAGRVRSAVERVLNDGYRTADIIGEGEDPVPCSRMGDLVVEAVRRG
ncbi:MAG: 3-isopropylmalate dehydrogenase [bacterium]|nr:MAG: 3-isopropylmalate dehydrogenase [bacterium]